MDSNLIDFICYALAALAILMMLCAYLLILISILGKGNDKDGKHNR